MTNEELQALHDDLVVIEAALIALENRVDALEAAVLPKGEYFEQIIDSFHCNPNCCGDCATELTLDGSWLLNGNQTLNGVMQ